MAFKFLVIIKAQVQDGALENGIMTVTLLETESSDLLPILNDALNAHVKEVTGYQRTPVHFVLQEESGECVGGLRASYLGQTFLISWLVVLPALRGQGWGKKLMEAAEAKAKDLVCKQINVDTLSFQAPEFYKSLGYEETARVHNFLDTYDKIFFRKNIG